jgi:ABC-2 type transport system permease protein
MDKYNIDSAEVDSVRSPVEFAYFTIVEDKGVPLNADLVSSLFMAQGIVVPVAVFLMITMVSQIVISAIATEKIDKTLETLLSTPVSRLSVILSKILAATFVAILNAAVSVAAMSSFMTTTVDSAVNLAATGGADVSEIQDAAGYMTELGMTLGGTQIFLVGLQLFLTIMIVLSVSIMLGTLASDIKSQQTLIMPLMLASLAPYIISIFSDINALPFAFRAIMYAIPFTHSFTAMPNVMFGHMGLYLFGLVYQIIFFVVCMALALKLFTSDKLFTMSLNLGQKKKLKETLGHE